MIRFVQGSDARCAPLDLARLLRVRDQHAKASTPFLAFTQDLAVIPDAAVGGARVRENGVLVALRIPPAANASNDLGDRFIVGCGRGRVGE